MGSGDGVKDPQAYSANEVRLEFGDGRYLFKLKLKQLAELEENCNAGIGSIYIRVSTGEYKALDLLESVRLGLIGGGNGVVRDQEVRVTPEMARSLVERYCDRPLEEVWGFAKAILDACVVGYSNPEAKSGKAEAATVDLEPTGSTSPRPTQTELPLEG